MTATQAYRSELKTLTLADLKAEQQAVRENRDMADCQYDYELWAGKLDTITAELVSRGH